jgi:hypothetical protein
MDDKVPSAYGACPVHVNSSAWHTETLALCPCTHIGSHFPVLIVPTSILQPTASQEVHAGALARARFPCCEEDVIGR